MSFHNTVLSQVLKMFPRLEFEKLSSIHDGKRRSDALSRWSQFAALAIGQIGARHSLRDIEATIESQPQQQYHLGSQKIKRTTFSRANEKLDYQFYSDLFSKLYKQCSQHSPKHNFRFKSKLFSLDGSLIDLSMKLFPWADYNKKKSAMKLHIGLDHDGLIPAFASLTGAKESEMKQVDLWKFPKGSVLVFDKGYNNFSWHKALSSKGLVWVTRIRGNAKYKVVKTLPTTKNLNIISDQIIEYTGQKSLRENLPAIRLVNYYDPVTQKDYQFITNQMNWSAQTIADIYKERWQVELFFKWIKQNLKIKAFLGNSKNAVMTQIMAALCVYLIIAFLKFQSGSKKSFQQILRLLQMNLFIRRPLIELLKPPPNVENLRPQMSLGLVRN
ncbi:IS4 family transposase [Thiomicrorhabdus sp. Milos-T2]|uniref:IS4 family transposase n=1 Tax=Thiomicrorhabdus sp. Milos-T2 TaxID=90814 RepID=UPI000493D52A|nr:IS4 family transposase [Thiomicrorhabdus sp. Milos-T2]